jgi:hypothetical protein
MEEAVHLESMDEAAYQKPRGRSCLHGTMDEAAYLAPWMKRLTCRHG